MTAAADTLAGIARADGAATSSRVLAARAVLELGSWLRSGLDLEQPLERLEQAVLVTIGDRNGKRAGRR